MARRFTAGRLADRAGEEQHDDQQREAEHAFRRGRDEKSGQRFRYADEHAADERAGHRTEAADDDDDEGEQRIAGTECAA